mmetsp:Transcript_64553/g.95526  ORF Transcript_64553/g.95526 Transcript_64553/m.95526 type:complete len:85 (+) Transcript_64553:193-447(+)
MMIYRSICTQKFQSMHLVSHTEKSRKLHPKRSDTSILLHSSAVDDDTTPTLTMYGPHRAKSSRYKSCQSGFTRVFHVARNTTAE